MLKRIYRSLVHRGGAVPLPDADPFSDRRSLFDWSEMESFRNANAFEGIAIFGATGSGKSSGSGRTLARSMLRAGYGGLVLSVKNERPTWERWARESGRSEHLVVMEPGGEWTFNPFDFELRRPGRGGGSVENVIHLLSTLVGFADRGASGKGGGRDSEDYWRRAMQEMLRNFAWLLFLARGTVSLDDLCRAINSAPRSLEEVGTEHWKSWSFCYELLAEADGKVATPSGRRELVLVTDYVLKLFPGLSDRTRSVIVSSFTSMADVLRRCRMDELFGKRSSVTPQFSEEGCVILVDLPVLEFGMEGLLANAIMKHCWCQSIQRRDPLRSRRPVFLYVDEAHHLVTPEDALFTTTCRSARVSTVLITQSIANLRTALGGGEGGRDAADALLANLNTRIFHANGDANTNEFASTLIGKRRQLLMNGSDSTARQDWAGEALGLSASGQVSAGFSEQWDFEVRPESFPLLRNGGESHRGTVEAVVVKNGGVFKDTGAIWRLATFQQGPRETPAKEATAHG